MKKLSALLVVIFSLSAFAGTEVRNGGGGISSNGQYMTFKTAQVPVLSKELKVNELPGLNILVDHISKSFLSANTKAILFTKIMPSSVRHYYRADETRMSADERAAIEAEYLKTMGVSKGNLIIFAVTDARFQSTVLFDSFVKLKPVEQAAIILHEALWAAGTTRDYSQVVQTEMAAQEYFETQIPNDQQRWAFYSNLLLSLNDYSQIVSLGFALDPLKHEQVSLKTIFGEEGYQCLAFNTDRTDNSWDDCREDIINNLAVLLATYPEDHLYEALYGYIVQPGNSVRIEKFDGTRQAAAFDFRSLEPTYFRGSATQAQSLELPIRTADGYRVGTLEFR